uniref:Retinol dehydrogenase 14 n=1 Tax=Plectus sambesii TaxID=2011161 RepID=A0A914ULA4_9BILA
MCNILFAFALHRRVNQSGVNVYVLHPGVIKTALHRGGGLFYKIFQFLGTPFFRSIEQGAATTVYCATDPELDNISDKYFENCWDDEKRLQKSLARDEVLQEALWKHTEDFLREYENK